MYPGVLSLIDHDKHILNVDFCDGDKAVGVPFNLVKRQDGQFCDESVTLDKRRPGTKRSKTTHSKAGYKWRHTGVHRMRFEEPKFPGQPLAEHMMLSNNYDLLINGKWQKQKDFDHVSLKDAVNHPELSDVYTGSLWEFAQDMYYKQPKKHQHGYHFGTVNVQISSSDPSSPSCGTLSYISGTPNPACGKFWCTIVRDMLSAGISWASGIHGKLTLQMS